MRGLSPRCLDVISNDSGDCVIAQLRWNNARIYVQVRETPSGRSANRLENRFVERYNQAYMADSPAAIGAIIADIYTAILDAGRTSFDEVAPPLAPDAGDASDMQTALFPEEYTFQFYTFGGYPQMIRKKPAAANKRGGNGSSSPGHLNLVVDPNCSLPRYSTTELKLLEDIADDLHLAYVVINDRGMCAVVRESKGPAAAQREFDCLWKITAAHASASLRVPELLGLIVSPDGERVVGFLEEYVPGPDPTDPRSLADLESVAAIEKPRRRKWAMQIRETVQKLHELGLTWGDAAASNVLVHHESDDAWLVDFAGGVLDGREGQELSGNVQGDELAVTKTFEFLQV